MLQQRQRERRREDERAAVREAAEEQVVPQRFGARVLTLRVEDDCFQG